MTDTEAGEDPSPGGSTHGASRARTAAGILGLGLLALGLAMVGYYRPVLFGGLRNWPLTGDAAFYAYQFARMGELGGRWWQLGQDELVGAPYQPEFGKHPGIFEGVELLATSSLTSRWLDPVTNYHALMLLVLVGNGLIVGGIVRRLTGSWAYAALGVVLVTWNVSTAFRLQGHAHLFKYCWTVLAVLAFSRFLDRPGIGRGILLGLAMALVLQGSFYLGFLLGLACGVWWLGCLVAGRVRISHAKPVAMAVLSFALAAASLTFPLWAISRSSLLADAYQGHSRIDAWNHGADLWQYFLPPYSSLAREYLADFNAHLKPARSHLEGWHYPGGTILLGLSAYLVYRLRGRVPPVSDPALIDRMVGLSGLLVLLSLAGGPSFFLLSGIACFRAYGRAGLLALALWCVAAPVILHACIAHRRRRWVHPVACFALMGLALLEGHHAASWFPARQTIETPAWVDWLAEQPADLRLAAFPPARDGLPEGSPFEGLLHRVRHRHACLIGADAILLGADLRLLRASYEQMNESGLRFIASLGYQALAFHGEYLAANPWITSVSWLEPIETRGPWSFFRTTPRFEPIPGASLHHLLANFNVPADPRDVPAASWITGRIATDRDVVVGPCPPVWLAWQDGKGRPAGAPTLGLYQHLHGPGIPSFAIKTPRSPGDYRLVILDQKRRPVASRDYRVRADLETGLKRITDHPGGLGTSPFRLTTGDGNAAVASVTLENRSPYFLQASSSRDQVYLHSARSHAGALREAAGSLVLGIRIQSSGKDRPVREQDLLLPCDVAPGGRLVLSLPRAFSPLTHL